MNYEQIPPFISTEESLIYQALESIDLEDFFTHDVKHLTRNS